MRTKTESLARKNWRSLSLRSLSDMAAKQVVLAVKVADLADLAAAEKVVLVAEGVVLEVQVVDEVVLEVQVLLAVLAVPAATDLVDLILTHNHNPSV